MEMFTITYSIFIVFRALGKQAAVLKALRLQTRLLKA